MENKPINYAHFEAVEIRVGKVVLVEDFPEARVPAYRMIVDFGPLGHKKTSAQITDLYTKDDLLGRLVLAVYNLTPKQIGKFVSEVLVLGVVPEDQRVVLIGPDRDTPLGLRIL
ncbi:MAG: tRNA-binding protein [Bacillota bacterium]